jgi:7-cyano-7-deazaguanine synthase
MRAVVLVSGGMDSLVTAATAVAAGRECAFVHVTYGQRTAGRERRAFEQIADFYRPCKRLVADISYLAAIGGSALTDESIPVPDIYDAVLGAGPCAAAPAGAPEPAVPVTYVPFRNAHLLAIATSLAEVERAGEIYIGATQVDYSGYPDCRREFYDAFEKAIEIGTKPDTHVKIITPVINMSKADIVREGLRLKAPFQLSWSCYTRSDRACGKCESCALRLKGFAEAGVKDPIPYA